MDYRLQRVRSPNGSWAFLLTSLSYDPTHDETNLHDCLPSISFGDDHLLASLNLSYVLNNLEYLVLNNKKSSFSDAQKTWDRLSSDDIIEVFLDS